MLSQFMRSSRGLLIVGAVVAIAAFAVVVLLLNQKSTKTGSGDITSTVTATVLTSPTATPTPVFQVAAAIRDVPANTNLTSSADVARYFKDVTPPSSFAVPGDAVDGITGLETKVISGTAFLGTIQIVNRIRQNAVLRSSDYRILPFSPPGSLAYSIGPGHVALTVKLDPLNSDYYAILPGDIVDVLMTIRQHALDSLTSNPPSDNTGPIETQQIISNARIIATVPITGLYTVEMPLQDALLMKYVRDSNEATVDLALVSSEDVRTQAAAPRTNPIVPEYFQTPGAVATVPGVTGTPGTPIPTQPGGLPNPLRAFPTFTFTPVPPTPVH